MIRFESMPLLSFMEVILLEFFLDYSETPTILFPYYLICLSNYDRAPFRRALEYSTIIIGFTGFRRRAARNFSTQGRFRGTRALR